MSNETKDRQNGLPEAAEADDRAPGKPPIQLVDVRQNNLKGFDLALQRGRFTVVTGPSGSGKSSLAFDTLYAEGQRRYVESLSTYVRQFLERMPRPDVEAVHNIPPAIALEQRNAVRSSRSTVATATEIYDFLRLLYATVGDVHCEKCRKAVAPEEPGGFADRLLAERPGEAAVVLFDAFAPGAKPKERQAKVAELQAAGYVRTWLDGEMGRLEDYAGSAKPPVKLRIAVDRVRLEGERRTRLAEALSGALDQGLGFASVAVGDELFATTSRFACADCRLTYERPVPRLFSFNSPFGACPECKGFGNILELDRNLIIPDSALSLGDGAIEPFTKPAYERWMHKVLEKAAAKGVDVSAPIAELSPAEVDWLFEGDKGFPGIFGYFKRLEAKKYKLHVRVFLSRYKSERRCEGCGGGRLNVAARRVHVAGRRIDEVTTKTFEQLRKFLVEARDRYLGDTAAERILNELSSRCDYALEVGLGYLTLDRQMRTLSGGEAQRIGLANQLGSGLTDTLYVLDEPTIGLHPHNTERLLQVLRNLVDRGNTLVVVEHDPDVINKAEEIVELGPGSGERGGELIYAGAGGRKFKGAGTLTAEYLSGAKNVVMPGKRRPGSGKRLSVLGAKEHNLCNVDLHVPLGTLTCVTGVSGSGKSTLVHQTLYGALARVFGIEYGKLGRFEEIHGLNLIRGAVLVDQQPIGKTARSIPASYIGIYDDIRKLLAQTLDARLHQYKPGHFSFNVPGGRCERCGGMGSETVEMHFLSDVEVECDVCHGTRFKAETLEVRHKGKNIADILNMTVDEAAKFFLHERRMMDRLRMMQQVGLGYLRLGQPARTLSGGESQRLKIAGELGIKRDKTIYILDEPTTGLHMDEVDLLLKVLNRLVDKGNTVLVIEHNLDVIKSADWVIDMGPGGGDAGGRIVAEGTPEDVTGVRKSVTGRHLKNVLKTAQLSF